MGQLAYLDVSANKLTPKGIDALWTARADWQTVVEVSDNLASPELAGTRRSGPRRTGSTHAVGEVLRRLVPAPQ